ncbi:MAG TPA: hypothetical protein VNJ02_17750 [Vicinamibacterales bacterium]|nr:hypothetical protein [Vicinamibacterales bacterium]
MKRQNTPAAVTPPDAFTDASILAEVTSQAMDPEAYWKHVRALEGAFECLYHVIVSQADKIREFADDDIDWTLVQDQATVIRQQLNAVDAVAYVLSQAASRQTQGGAR